MEFDSRITLLVLAIVVILGAAAFLYKPQSAPVTAAEAGDFVLNDVKTTYGEDVCMRASDVQKTDDSWHATVLFSVAPNTACPLRVERDYAFLPLTFRENKLVASCTPPTLISFEEEAIAKTAQLADVKNLGNAHACGYKLDAPLACCAAAEAAALQPFAQAAAAKGAKFAVLWTASSGAQRYYALDANGQTVAQASN